MLLNRKATYFGVLMLSFVTSLTALVTSSAITWLSSVSRYIARRNWRWRAGIPPGPSTQHFIFSSTCSSRPAKPHGGRLPLRRREGHGGGKAPVGTLRPCCCPRWWLHGHLQCIRGPWTTHVQPVDFSVCVSVVRWTVVPKTMCLSHDPQDLWVWTYLEKGSLLMWLG